MFRDSHRPEDVVERASHTMLTRFFDLCATDDNARQLLYHEVPNHYVWRSGHWHTRLRGGDKAVGRMVSVPPSDAERYYMRMLLCYRRGPTSFDDLRTVNGIVYDRYRAAVEAAGLLDSDVERDNCLTKASTFRMPRQMRSLFATILVYCHPTDPRSLWDKHLTAISEDFIHQAQVDTPTPAVIFQVLSSLDQCLQSNSKTLADFEDLPQLTEYAPFRAPAPSGNRLVHVERSYPQSDLQRVLSTLDSMTDEQRAVFSAVIGAVNDPNSSERVFFVDGPGGTGKSFLLEKILAQVRLHGGIALAVASSGITAQLLSGGRTAHSRFKIKLDLDEDSLCNIPLNSDLAGLIRECKIIVWDEAPMAHRHALESVDRTLSRILDDPRPFGGKVVLLAGDFRQIFPVVPRAGDAQIIASCIQNTRLWRTIPKFRLSVNLRLQGTRLGDAREREDFGRYLLDIDNGVHETHPSLIPEYARIPSDLLIDAVPADMHEVTERFNLNVRRIVDHLFSDINSLRQDAFEYLNSRAILTPLNADVDLINNEVLRRLHGDHIDYLSVDTVECEEEMQRELNPVEILNTINVSGIPQHRLRLKVGATILLMRNLDAERGLCNGTRLLIRQLAPHCIDAVIMNGTFKGQSTLIPRISLITREPSLPFQIRRKQFPVQLAFAMTINKAQGQSIEHLAVYLPQPVFSHGQLYVALSRATLRRNVKVLIADAEKPDGENGAVYTRNIVYRQV